MISVRIDLGTRSYDILIQPGLIKDAGNYIGSVVNGKKVAVISDTNVGKLYSAIFLQVLRESGLEPVYITIEPGEFSKTMEAITRLCRQFVKAGLDRNSSVIAFGGGVVGDTAGLAAAVFLRGIHFIQVPTTLLADCDSAVGGKVGVNLDNAKNLLGAFYQPKLVLIDPELLKTLPKRELKAGLAEVVKTGLIGDFELYRIIFSNLDNIINLTDMEIMCDIIRRSAIVKADVVSRDERESGLRRILNFGHTIGHAIESVLKGTNILHGEAVLYGMRAATWISHNKSTLSETDYRTIIEDLSRITIPVDISRVSFERIIEFIKKDKKIIDNRLSYILLESIGKPYQTYDVGKTEMAEAFAFIQKQ